MGWGDFWIVLVVTVLAMWACRIIPLFLLKGRELPHNVERALNLIPPAAFAALVANDLLDPHMFDYGFWPALVPLLAAVAAAVVAVKTRSLLWTALAGVGVYALLMLVAG